MNNINTIYLEKLIIDNKFIEIINYFSEKLNIHKDKIFLNDIGIINDICFNYNLNNNFEDFYIINNSNNILYINNKNYTNNLIYFDNCSFLTIFNNNNNNNNNNNVYFLVIKNICKNNKFELSKEILNRKKFSNNIFLLESFLNENDCNYFLNNIDYYIENNIFKKDIWREHNNVFCYYCNISEYSSNSKMFRTIDKKLYKIIGDICKKLFIDFGIKCQGDSGYCLRKIYGETRIHSDNIFSDNTNKDINKIRNMSLIINLNDNYEGGEFYFPIQDYKIKLKQGDVILFPPYWTHPHMVYSPINNTYRYTINTWLFQ